MRILFIAPYLPSPTHFRALRVIQALSNLDHQVSVVALSSGGADDRAAAEALSQACDAVHAVPLSRGGSFVQKALHVATSTPLWAASFFSPALTATVGEVIAANKFDIAHVEDLRVAYVAPALKGRVPAVFDAGECVTDQANVKMQDAGYGTFEKFASRRDFEKLAGYEPRAAVQFDRVLTTSEQSAARLQELGRSEGLDLSMEVLPNGVDLDYFHPQESIPILPGNIVFPGQMNNFADRDAVSYFCDEIFPGIRNAYPLATVTFVGGEPTEELTALAADLRSGVQVTGRVADARPYLARAAVAVCPLRVTGSRNRVLQIMAMGKAMVASPAACRALDTAAAGQCLCLADMPLSFATQIIHLLNHPEEAARLGRNARAYVEERHDWSYIGRRLVQIYDEIISSRAYVAA